jgi:hypothetical protein
MQALVWCSLVGAARGGIVQRRGGTQHVPVAGVKGSAGRDRGRGGAAAATRGAPPRPFTMGGVGGRGSDAEDDVSGVILTQFLSAPTLGGLGE